MSELIKALEAVEYVDAALRVGGKDFPVKVKVFCADDFENEIKALSGDDAAANANRLAGYFIDPQSLQPVFTPEKLMGKTIKNCFIRRLCQLFTDCNRGLEGN